MDEKPIEWLDIWHTSTLYVTEIKKGDRSIYTLSNPMNDDVININGEELKMFAKDLLEREE